MATALDSPSLSREDLALKRDWKKFIALNFLFAFGFTLYNGVFQNFLRDTMQTTALGLGRLESLREIPGLLTALTAGTLVVLAEARIAALGLLIAGIGIALTGAVSSYPLLTVATVFWSIGFHLWAGMSNAITLNLAKGQEGGRHLGRITGIASIATLLGLGTSLVLSKLFPLLHLSAQSLYVFDFVVGGACIVVGGILCYGLSSNARSVERAPIIFRKEYGLYYLLSFLEGCRRQIFGIFASFALIIVYKVPVSTMLLLQFVNAILISMTAPRMGRMIDKYGERSPLTLYSLGLILVFVGYATSKSVGVLYALFIIDNVLFTFGVGFTTYLHRIVRPNELTPCLSMGVTMNHIAAVTVPWGGALLWDRSGNYQIPFWVGVAIACISFFATLSLPKGTKAEGKRP